MSEREPRRLPVDVVAAIDKDAPAVEEVRKLDREIALANTALRAVGVELVTNADPRIISGISSKAVKEILGDDITLSDRDRIQLKRRLETYSINLQTQINRRARRDEVIETEEYVRQSAPTNDELLDALVTRRAKLETNAPEGTNFLTEVAFRAKIEELRGLQVLLKHIDDKNLKTPMTAADVIAELKSVIDVELDTMLDALHEMKRNKYQEGRDD